MTVDDRTRLQLHRKLEDVLGPEEAATLMAHLPPVTWNDVATKEDLRVLGAELRFELRAELATQMNRQTWRLMTVMVGWSGILTGVIAIFN